jgi:peptidoglycan hydrolase-like protein with peptidoglycan-binding domain
LARYPYVFASRKRLAGVLCFLLTLGTTVNVFIIQGGRGAPEAASAMTLPQDMPETLTGASVIKPAATRAVQPSAAQTSTTQALSDADADLASPAAGTSETLGSGPASDDGSANATLIASIQRELAGRGYDPGRANGKAGIITRSAILAFQFDQHLTMTAEPSEELLRQIVMGIAGSPASQTAPALDKAARIIAGAQRLLTRLGYRPGPIDGQLNDATRKALRHFEGDSGFVPKGRVSGEVISELARRAHARIEVSDEALTH